MLNKTENQIQLKYLFSALLYRSEWDVSSKTNTGNKILLTQRLCSSVIKKFIHHANCENIQFTFGNRFLIF